MNERTSRILEAVIEEFIRAGEPVSSGLLYDQYDFGIKPAMIRLELDALEGAGYLEQPYHSAGRVPTDTGYEFFAGRVLHTSIEPPSTPTIRELFEEHAWLDLLHAFSRELGALSVATDSLGSTVYKTGLEFLVKHLDWSERDEVEEVIHDFEEVDARLPRAAEKIGEGPKVFIGKKSPMTKSEQLSVIGGNYQLGDSRISIFVIGPKRMDYRKAIQLFKNL